MDDKIKTILERGVEEIIDRDHLLAVLESGKKLRVKLGIDPTAPDIHLGHTVPLRKLRHFQAAGHQIVLIIGDFTATIGDPSGRSEERKPLTDEDVKKNMKKYLDQAAKVIDIKKTEVRYNSEWHRHEGLASMLELARAATFQQVVRRADFQKRIEEGRDISLMEMLYPLLQGYDSVKIKADVEIGGTDQKFNLLMGRRVQRHFGQAEQDVMMLPLIEGLDGVKKMSKSYGNYIAVDEKPNEMFGKVMAVPDPLLKKYFECLTEKTFKPEDNPYGAKIMLAYEIVKMCHSKEAAEAAHENFIRTFSKKELPDNVETVKATTILEAVRASGVPSNSEVMRLLKQNAVEKNEKTVTDPKELVKKGDVIRVGKKKFVKIG
jgi:tyrosyl-tRNA synthetase